MATKCLDTAPVAEVEFPLAKVCAISVLSHSFSTLGEKSNRLNRAYQYLTLTSHYQPTFANNVATAYEILSTSSGKVIDLSRVSLQSLVLDQMCRQGSNFIKNIQVVIHYTWVIFARLVPNKLIMDILCDIVLTKFYNQVPTSW